MHTTRMRCVLAGVLASALVGGAQAGLFGGGGNGGGGFDSGPAMGGGGFEAPTNMLGGGAPASNGPLPGLGGGGFVNGAPPMQPPPVQPPPVANGPLPGLGGGGFVNGAPPMNAPLMNAPLMNAPSLQNGSMNAVGAMQGPAVQGGLGMADATGGPAPTGGYQGMVDAGMQAGRSLWNNSTPGMLWNAGQDAYQRVATPEARQQLVMDVARHQIQQRVLQPFEGLNMDPYVKFDEPDADGNFGYRVGLQGTYEPRQMEAIRTAFDRTGMSQRLPNGGQNLDPQVLPDGTNVAVLFRGDNVYDALEPLSTDQRLVDGARLHVGGPRIGLANTQVPDGFTAEISPDVVNHMIDRNRDQIVGKTTTIGIHKGTASSTTTGLEFRNGGFAMTGTGRGRSGRATVNSQGSGNANINGMVHKPGTSAADPPWLQATLSGQNTSGTPRLDNGWRPKIGNRKVARESPGTTARMLSASLNGPYTEVGGVSAGSNLIRGGGLFGNRPTGVNTSYSVPVYVDVHGMLRDHGLPNVRLDSVHADANRGLIFQTQPGSLKREALHQVQRRIQ